jgi:hypothetical protein
MYVHPHSTLRALLEFRVGFRGGKKTREPGEKLKQGREPTNFTYLTPRPGIKPHKRPLLNQLS